MFVRYEDAKWQKIIPELGEDGPEICILRVDPKTQAQGFLLRIDDAPPLPGAAVTAYLELPGDAKNGVTIPRDAVVRFGGNAWAYVKTKSDEFARREVALDQPTDKGWFISEGFKPGENIVVAGAQSLLSEQQKSQLQSGESD